MSEEKEDKPVESVNNQQEEFENEISKLLSKYDSEELTRRQKLDILDTVKKLMNKGNNE